MIKKKDTLTFSSPLTRAAAYIVLFTIGSVSFQAVHDLISYRTALPGILIILALPLIGALCISERHLFSRITSASVLLLLSVIAIQFGNVPVPSEYILALALGVAWLGAQPFLHRDPSSTRRTALYSAGIAIVAITLTIAFAFTMVALTRMAFQSQGL
jgi:hypothetical protein